MIVTHKAPEGWPGDTGESGKVQPSQVAGMAHVVQMEADDMSQFTTVALVVKNTAGVVIPSNKVAATLRYVSVPIAGGQAVYLFVLTLNVIVAQASGVKVALPDGMAPGGSNLVSFLLLGPDATARVAKLLSGHMVVGAAYAGAALASVPAGSYFASGQFLS